LPQAVSSGLNQLIGSEEGKQLLDARKKLNELLPEGDSE